MKIILLSYFLSSSPQNMTTLKKEMWDIKMRQKTPVFAETGSCFDATKIAGMKVSNKL